MSIYIPFKLEDRLTDHSWLPRCPDHDDDDDLPDAGSWLSFTLQLLLSDPWFHNRIRIECHFSLLYFLTLFFPPCSCFLIYDPEPRIWRADFASGSDGSWSLWLPSDDHSNVEHSGRERSSCSSNRSSRKFLETDDCMRWEKSILYERAVWTLTALFSGLKIEPKQRFQELLDVNRRRAFDVICLMYSSSFSMSTEQRFCFPGNLGLKSLLCLDSI